MTEFSEIKSVAPRDWLIGTALSVGSAMLHKLPESWDFITRKPSESSVQLRWRHLNRTPAELAQQWVHHHGVEGAKKLPRNFKLAQVMLIDRDELTKLRASQRKIYSLNCEPAVTYRLGSTVMMGTALGGRRLFEDRLLSGEEAPDFQDYQMAMGLGEGPLDGGVGIYGIDYFNDKAYRGLDKGVRPGPVMPIAELPPYVPLV